MDDLRKPGQDDARREDEAAGSATGVFGVVPPAAVGSGPASWQDVPAKVELAPPFVPPVVPADPPVVPLPATAKVVQPVVHRVVVGGDASGKASDYDELLNRLRGGAVSNASAAERKSAEARPVKAEAPVVAPAAVPPATPVPEPVAGVPAEMRKIEVQTIDLRGPMPVAGFDALLRTPPPVVKTAEVVQEVTVAPAALVENPSPGGFTALLRTGSAEALDFGRPVAGTPVAAAQDAPGSFTQMFQALDAKAAPAITAAAPVVPAAESPGSFTQMLRAPEAKDIPGITEVAPVPALRPAPAEDSPGSFTAMFRALDAKAENAPVGSGVTPSAPASLSAGPPVPTASSPGSFTQMFRALDAKPEAAPSAPVFQAPPPVSPSASAAGSPGTFTQLFRTLDSPGSAPAAPAPVARMDPPPVAPQKKEAGSFTQMLSAQRPADVPSYAAPREPQRAVPNPGAWEPAPGQGSFGASMPVEPERRPEPSGGGLTQLLRTLDGPSSAPVRREEPPVMPSSATGPGMFTQTYQRLEEPAPAPMALAPGATGLNHAVPPMTPAPPVAAGGPSEFTRILDASRMREMGLRGEMSVMPPVQGGPSGTPAMPQMVAPVMPQMAPPLMPQPMMPQMPAPQGMAPAPAPAYAMPAYAPPQMAAPAAPAVALPEAKPPASGMQKYLPAILIGVIFLLVAVVIALVFLMRH